MSESLFETHAVGVGCRGLFGFCLVTCRVQEHWQFSISWPLSRTWEHLPRCVQFGAQSVELTVFVVVPSGHFVSQGLLCCWSVIGGWLGRVCTTLHLHAPYITHSSRASFVFCFFVLFHLLMIQCNTGLDECSSFLLVSLWVLTGLQCARVSSICVPSMVQP